MKTNILQPLASGLPGTVKNVWRRFVLAGAREVEELRSRSGPRCPQCDGLLIFRRVGFGRDAGKGFWDCSNVGRCSTSLAADAVPWPEQPSPFSAAAA
jgi:hypothetical protein